MIPTNNSPNTKHPIAIPITAPVDKPVSFVTVGFGFVPLLLGFGLGFGLGLGFGPGLGPGPTLPTLVTVILKGVRCVELQTLLPVN